MTRVGTQRHRKKRKKIHHYIGTELCLLKKITTYKNLKWVQLTIKMCVVKIFEFGEMVSFIKRPVVKCIVKVRVSVWMQH